ncbi:zinc finger, C2H2 type [Ditylenchus destructor]|uniref:Zinc finger, C2H2 type n=1 Tax=Ditylenchus destructor TaxID=166010 RepID=A0AAD4MVT2_9BILA|nr:zinc finger, C2H2 type [Ditylenchus destructor]
MQSDIFQEVYLRAYIQEQQRILQTKQLEKSISPIMSNSVSESYPYHTRNQMVSPIGSNMTPWAFQTMQLARQQQIQSTVQYSTMQYPAHSHNNTFVRPQYPTIGPMETRNLSQNNQSQSITSNSLAHLTTSQPTTSQTEPARQSLSNNPQQFQNHQSAKYPQQSQSVRQQTMTETEAIQLVRWRELLRQQENFQLIQQASQSQLTSQILPQAHQNTYQAAQSPYQTSQMVPHGQTNNEIATNGVPNNVTNQQTARPQMTAPPYPISEINLYPSVPRSIWYQQTTTSQNAAINDNNYARAPTTTSNATNVVTSTYDKIHEPIKPTPIKRSTTNSQQTTQSLQYVTPHIMAACKIQGTTSIPTSSSCTNSSNFPEVSQKGYQQFETTPTSSENNTVPFMINIGEGFTLNIGEQNGSNSATPRKTPEPRRSRNEPEVEIIEPPKKKSKADISDNATETAVKIQDLSKYIPSDTDCSPKEDLGKVMSLSINQNSKGKTVLEMTPQQLCAMQTFLRHVHPKSDNTDAKTSATSNAESPKGTTSVEIEEKTQNDNARQKCEEVCVVVISDNKAESSTSSAQTPVLSTQSVPSAHDAQNGNGDFAAKDKRSNSLSQPQCPASDENLIAKEKRSSSVSQAEFLRPQAPVSCSPCLTLPITTNKGIIVSASISQRASTSTSVDDEEDFVDVVGGVDGVPTNPTRLQRKAHIDFFRKIKAFRNRHEKSLECQMCQETIHNTEVGIRSHVHQHSDRPLFVCKICQKGYKEQHLIFEHICESHPGKNRQHYEDRRDMGQLSEILLSCFPRSGVKSRSTYTDCLDKVLSIAKENEWDQVTCTLCDKKVNAQRTNIVKHLHLHPCYRCKKCKFVSNAESEQIGHQAQHHPTDNNTATNPSTTPIAFESVEKAGTNDQGYNISMALEIFRLCS